MTAPPFLSIVIPAYNEQDNFAAKALAKVTRYLKPRKWSYEVIIVDDGSTDGSIENIQKFVAQNPHWRLIKNPHLGKAQTVATGIMEATGENVLFTDFDQATPLSEVEKLLPFIKKNYHIVIGSREVQGSKREKEPWYRHFMGRGFNFIVSLVALRGIHDTQCGFKLFKTAVAKDLFGRLVVYSQKPEKAAFTGAFDVEVLYLAQKQKLRLAEVPVHWKHIKTSRVNPVKDSLRMFVDLLRIRLTDVLGGYQSPFDRSQSPDGR
ncbi:MAG: glycosyltransferase family 2 protein [Candidatus Chisholmbacteria bacterium]|nr:glycosyltransferase family 2 protein [Candidatus Chisholmbacteria bacterium]